MLILGTRVPDKISRTDKKFKIFKMSHKPSSDASLCCQEGVTVGFDYSVEASLCSQML